MRNSFITLLAALLVTLSAASAQTPPRFETGFLDRSVTLGGQTYRYQIYVPASYVTTQQWPVIVFLHGE